MGRLRPVFSWMGILLTQSLALSAFTAHAGLVFSQDPVKGQASKGSRSATDEAEPGWEDLNSGASPRAEAGTESVRQPRNSQLSEVVVEAPVTETLRSVPARSRGRTATDAASPRVREAPRIRSSRDLVYSPRRGGSIRESARMAQASDEYITPQGRPNGRKPRMSAQAVPEAADSEDMPVESGRGADVNAAFPYTHSLPSPLNIPGGTWQVGSTVAVGVTDFLQISTNVVRDAYRFWNISAKVPLIEYPTFIASAFVTWDTQNLRHYDERNNPDLRVTSWQPGLVTGYEIADDMAFFVGGNFYITKTKLPDGIRTSGFSRGARVNADWSYLYNPPSSRLRDNAISAGATYDVTYKLWGIGATHHWSAFQLGFHYTLNADNNRMLPTFAFSTGFSF